MTDLPEDPVAYAEGCERVAGDLLEAIDYDEGARALLRTGIPDLAAIVRERQAEIDRLRSVIRRATERWESPDAVQEILESALETDQ